MYVLYIYMNKKETNNIICLALFIVLVILLICIFNHDSDIIEGMDAEKAKKLAAAKAAVTEGKATNAQKQLVADELAAAKAAVTEGKATNAQKQLVADELAAAKAAVTEGGATATQKQLVAEDAKKKEEGPGGGENTATKKNTKDDVYVRIVRDSNILKSETIARVDDMLEIVIPKSALTNKNDVPQCGTEGNFTFKSKDTNSKDSSILGIKMLKAADDNSPYICSLKKAIGGDVVQGTIKYIYKKAKGGISITNVAKNEEGNPITFEIEKQDETVTKLDNYKEVLNKISELAKNDEVFNKSVKDIYPQYVAVKNINTFKGAPIICTNKSRDNCTLENEINWNVVLTVSSLIVTDKGDSFDSDKGGSTDGFDNIEGFSNKHKIYLLDVENMLEKIKDTPKETILNNLKNVLVWKKVSHAGDIGEEGSIKFQNGEWVEQRGGTTSNLKDMKQKGYSIIGKISAQKGIKKDLLSVLNVLSKSNPSSDIASLQLATHLFFEQPLYIRANKYVYPTGYTQDQQNIIQDTRKNLVKMGALPEIDCYIGVGAQYKGKINTWTDSDGNIQNCARWDSSDIPTTSDKTNIRGGIIMDYNIGDVGKADPKFLKGGSHAHLVNSNYCRNPDPLGKTGEKPWCYTEKSGVRWAQCDITQCAGKQQPTHSSSTGRKPNTKKCGDIIDEENQLLKKKIKMINTILRKENKVLDGKIIRLYKTLEGTQEAL